MHSEPWRSDLWWTSPFNHVKEVRSGLDLPKTIAIHDATLRDGEQTPGIVLRKEDKVRIAQKLAEVGVERIEAGMPAVSREDAQAVTEICKLGLKARVFTFARAMKADIDMAKDCGADGVVIEVPIGEPKLVHQFGWTGKDVVNKSVDALAYAKERGLHTLFFPYDTTRAKPEVLEEVLTGVVAQSTPDSIGVVDTTGCALPSAAAYLTRLVKRITGLPVEIHTHNDLGLGVATALAAVAAGAEVVHTCVNGLGERTGNAALEEVMVCLKLLYGYDNEYKIDELQELSKLVRELTGFPMAPNKPIVGSGNFVRESGIGIDMVYKFPLAMFSLNPPFVGQVPRVVLGKKSGAASIRQAIHDLKLDPLPEEGTERLLQMVKSLGIEKRGLVSEAEFVDLYGEVRG